MSCDPFLSSFFFLSELELSFDDEELSVDVVKCADTTPESARQSIIEEAQDAAGNETVKSTVTSAEVRTQVKELVDLNKSLRKEYNTKCNNWQSCNNRACIQLRKTLGTEAASLVSQITAVREAFKKLLTRKLH